MKGLRRLSNCSYCRLRSVVRIDLIYEGIATAYRVRHTVIALNGVRIDLIYEGIATPRSNFQCVCTNHVRIDLIYEGIATNSAKQLTACNSVRIDLIYEGIATLPVSKLFITLYPWSELT